MIITNNKRDYQMTKKTEMNKVKTMLEEGKAKGIYTNEDFIAWAKTMEDWRESNTKNAEAWKQAKLFIADWAKKIEEDDKAAKEAKIKRAKEELKKALEEAGMDYTADVEAEMAAITAERKAEQQKILSGQKRAETRRLTMEAKKRCIKLHGEATWKLMEKEDKEKCLEQKREEVKKEESEAVK